MDLKWLLLLFVAGCLYQRTKAITCYNCQACGDYEGLALDCTSLSTSDSCYLIKTEETGEVNKACGTDELDDLGFAIGCYSGYGLTACRCTTDYCNTNDLLTSTRNTASTTVTSSTTTQTQNRTITTTTQSSQQPDMYIQSDATTEYSMTTTQASSWQCYACNDCNESPGELIDCSLLSNSRACLLTKDTSGKVNQACDTEDISDIVEREDSCKTVGHVMVCRCFENGCNTVQRLLPRAKDSPEFAATPLLCHLCVNCGRSVGPLFPCTSSKSCSLVIENGKVTRSCGTTAIDSIIPEDIGCRTASGVTVCKCSTAQCNVFSGITGGVDDSLTSETKAFKQQLSSKSILCASQFLLFISCLISFLFFFW